MLHIVRAFGPEVRHSKTGLKRQKRGEDVFGKAVLRLCLGIKSLEMHMCLKDRSGGAFSHVVKERYASVRLSERKATWNE